MRIDRPAPEQTAALRTLWQEAFGDPDSYLDRFFAIAFSPERCRCVTVDGEVAAALYWFDMTCRDQPMAYIYAVATKGSRRGMGLCRALMEDTHRVLKARGCAGTILSPEGEDLARMYEKMGYAHCSGIHEFRCEAGTPAVLLRRVDGQTYNIRRNELLPDGGVRLEQTALEFLSAYAEFFVGDDFTLAAAREGKSLFGIELLGNVSAAPGILTALGCGAGTFRVPGKTRPFAMFCPLTDTAQAPAYMGFAFD